MTEIEKTVKELRGKYIAYDVTGNHKSAQLYKDAADAIEELEAKNKELRGRIEDEELKIDFLTADNTNYDIAIDKLKAQLEDRTNAVERWKDMYLTKHEPKRGKWILENYCWHCSVCGENPTRGMGYVQGKSELFRVCPNCGAKMEVQDEGAGSL